MFASEDVAVAELDVERFKRHRIVVIQIAFAHLEELAFRGDAANFMEELALSVNPAQSEEPLAEPHFLQSIAMLDAVDAHNDLALAYSGLGRLRTNQGRIVEAREHLTRALGIFERLGTLNEPDRVRLELNTLPRA